MWRALGLAAVLAIQGCGDRSAPPAPPVRDPARDFALQMKNLDRQVENLQADFAEQKPESVLRDRLARIREAAVAASGIEYRTVAAENRDLKYQFGLFLDSLGRLEKSGWRGEEGPRNWKLLTDSCMVCHSIYRVD